MHYIAVVGIVLIYNARKALVAWVWARPASKRRASKERSPSEGGPREKFNRHVDLVEDLVLELTRAANYICDVVRARLDPTFRLQEGAAVVTYGPTMLLEFTTVRPEYRPDERTELPYPGLDAFDEARLGRDFCFARFIDA
jgi:hypothetical protein